jgi:hypothetical protein
MKRNRCELEDEILRALNSAGISESVRQHLVECELCRHTVAADVWMKEMARQKLEEAPLPDPTLIWLKSQLLQNEGTLFHLGQSTSFLHTVGFGLVAFAWAILLSWKWTAIDSFVRHFDSAGTLLAAMNAQLFSLPFVFTLVVLSCATVGLAFHSAMAE